MNIGLKKFLLIFCVSQVNYATPIFKISNGASESNLFKTSFNDHRTNMQLHTVKIFSRDNVQTLKGYSCSGSIVDYEWIITSAHCVYGFAIIDVFIGMSHTRFTFYYLPFAISRRIFFFV
jgi:hypothetical protein